MPREPVPRDLATLLDIRLACDRILEFVAESNSDEFAEDAKTQSAVLHQLLIVGEATKRLSTEFRTAHAGVPWSQSGMRDRLIHGYDDVDLAAVWSTATMDVPRLLAEIRLHLPREGN